jgi:hypothetical protein
LAHQERPLVESEHLGQFHRGESKLPSVEARRALSVRPSLPPARDAEVDAARMEPLSVR